MTNYVNGSQWSVTWYGQIRGADDMLRPHDVNLAPQYQQYRKITNLILMVTNPLSRSQDEQSKEFEVTGQAIAYSFIKPNFGDTFIAQIDNGSMAIFTVTSSEQATYMKGSNYIINYQLVAYTDPALVSDLDKKSIQSYRFVPALFAAGQYPLLSDTQYALFTGLGDLYQNMLSMYFRDFFSVEFQTLIVPDQEFSTYDHWLTKAFVDLISTDENLNLPRIRMPAVRGDLAMVNVTVWDALMQVNRTTLLTGIQRAGLVDTIEFRNYPNLTGIAYSGIDQMVYPWDSRTDIDAQYSWVNDNPVSPYLPGKLRYKSLARNIRAADQAFFDTACQCVESADGQTILPNIVPVTTDDYYVFTAGLYEVQGQALKSTLEVLVSQTIQGQAPDREKLLALGNASFGWPNLERFYYVPAILAMIAISRQSS